MPVGRLPDDLDSAQALVVLGLSIAGFLVLAGVLLRRRDLA